jgi:hypothetical protein
MTAAPDDPAGRSEAERLFDEHLTRLERGEDRGWERRPQGRVAGRRSPALTQRVERTNSSRRSWKRSGWSR